MLYSLLYPLKDHIFIFNVFRYITFRAVAASILAFLFSVIIGPYLIRMLKQMKWCHSAEREGFSRVNPRQYQRKSKVPTMGGILIVLSILFAMILVGDWSNPYLTWTTFSLIWLAFIGWIDDGLKLRNKNSKGLLGFVKLSGQVVLALIIGSYLMIADGSWTQVSVPFLKDWFLPLGLFYLVFVCLVLAGASNAVNLTDGLDGLAIGCLIFVSITYAILSYISGHRLFAEYLYVPYISGVGELSVFCGAMVGAFLGFLWFNSYPASIFMGDTGSLSLGGVIGVIAVFIKKELLLLIVGGIFVVEALSVILQVSSFKNF